MRTLTLLGKPVKLIINIVIVFKLMVKLLYIIESGIYLSLLIMLITCHGYVTHSLFSIAN